MFTPAAANDEYGIMHPDAAYGRMPAVADAHARLRTVTVPPGSQDLLPYLDYVPADRNQGRTGNSRGAGTDVLEVAHAVQNGIGDRPSIGYLDANYRPSSPEYRWAGDGGVPDDFTTFYPSTGTAVPWSNPNAG